MPSVLQASGLTKSFGKGEGRIQAVRAVDVDLAAGEMAMVMGPSGSGKTTLLSMVGLLTRPDVGRLRLLGKDVTDWDERRLSIVRRRRLGFIFQDFRLLPSLTARQNVQLSAELSGLSKAKARDRADALLRQLGLGHRIGARPVTLSAGEKQRVAVARALANHPAVLLADEPTGNLDSASGRVVVELLRDVTRSHRVGVLIVSHDPRVCPYTDRMLHMEDGVVRSVTGAPPVNAG